MYSSRSKYKTLRCCHYPRVLGTSLSRESVHCPPFVNIFHCDTTLSVNLDPVICDDLSKKRVFIPYSYEFPRSRNGINFKNVIRIIKFLNLYSNSHRFCFSIFMAFKLYCGYGEVSFWKSNNK